MKDKKPMCGEFLQLLFSAKRLLLLLLLLLLLIDEFN